MEIMNGKKNSVCRYFAADGVCFYGDECQFIHSRPPSSVLPTRTNDQPRQLSERMAFHSANNAHRFNSVAHSYFNNNDQQLATQMSVLNLDSSNHASRIMTNAPIIQSSSSLQTNPVSSSYFVCEDIRSELARKLSIALEQPNPDLYSEPIPPQVDLFNELLPLQSSNGLSSSTFGMKVITSVYRATNINTGQLVCLYRIHSFQASQANTKTLMGTIETWKKINHPNIVSMKQVFTTKAFGDNSLIFVYNYFEGADNLMNLYFADSKNMSSSNGFSNASSRPFSQQKPQKKLFPEALLWNIIIQLSSALRAIHSAGLSYRAFDPTKILLTSGSQNPSSQLQPHQYPRLHLNCCGIFDVLTHDQLIASNNSRALVSHFQQEDLTALGKLILGIACNQLNAVQRDNLSQSFDLITRHYSSDLTKLICYLMRETPNANRSINDIMPMIGARFYTQLELMYERDDVLTDELSKEIDNGRLFRLISKLGLINERPEFHMDPNWSETGDRYLLKLFRDYLFHQRNEDGTPWLDMGHIVSTLNKLDSGTQEKICLTSRDEQNILIVSFAELKRCLEISINELL